MPEVLTNHDRFHRYSSYPRYSCLAVSRYEGLHILTAREFPEAHAGCAHKKNNQGSEGYDYRIVSSGASCLRLRRRCHSEKAGIGRLADALQSLREDQEKLGWYPAARAPIAHR
jgi:hypothetical protein